MPLPNFQPRSTEAVPSSNAQQAPQQPTDDRQSTGAGVDTGAGTTRPKTAEEVEADRLYEDAIEEEYAKREGGA